MHRASSTAEAFVTPWNCRSMYSGLCRPLRSDNVLYHSRLAWQAPRETRASVRVTLELNRKRPGRNGLEVKGSAGGGRFGLTSNVIRTESPDARYKPTCEG